MLKLTKMNVINIAKNFSKFPSGRYKSKGTTSGEEFRERFLAPAIQKNNHFIVELDGTIGYGSSFLEEAFGGLVRQLGLSPKQLLNIMEIKTENQALRLEVIDYINEEWQRKNNGG